MSGSIETRLADLGIELPQPAAPVANYVPFVISGGQVFVSGQIPLVDGKPQFVGRLGDSLTIEQGQQAARICGINLLAQLRNACRDDWSKVRRVVKLGGFVACTPDFAQTPQVINGASDLMVEVFGDIGRHARAAVGVSALPLGVAVEIEAVFEIA